MEDEQTQKFAFAPTPDEDSPFLQWIHPDPSKTHQVGCFSLTFHKLMCEFYFPFFSTPSSIFQYLFLDIQSQGLWKSLNTERIRLQQQKEQQKEKLEIPTAGQREKIDGDGQTRDWGNDEG